jgi:signal recognition particle receptor subunit beta
MTTFIRHSHTQVHGVVFVVDAADGSRFAECQKVLRETIELKHLHGKPILVLANKQDLIGAASSAGRTQM